MAFRTGTGSVISFDRAFETIESIASSIKTLSQQLRDRSSAGTLTGREVIRYFEDLGNQRNLLQDWVTKFSDAAAASAYAQDRYNDPTYDAVAEYSALLIEINNTLTYIAGNITTSLLTWDAAAGSVSWNSFAAAATADLRTQLDALIATVD